MTTDAEREYLRGQQAIARAIIVLCMPSLAEDERDKVRLLQERSEAVEALRSLCVKAGIPSDWSSVLHLADIVNKHVAPHLLQSKVPPDALTTTLMSLNEAADSGIQRVRKPIWADKMDHIKIDIVDGKLGPWLHLYSPFNKQCNGRDPVDFLGGAVGGFVSLNLREYEAYSGPLPTSEEYKAAVAKRVRQAACTKLRDTNAP